MLLQGKVALITGASRGIGRETAICFARQGADLAIAGRDEERLRKLASEIEGVSNGSPAIFVYDVRDFDSMKEAFRTIQQRYNRLDILVNNAGVLSDGLLAYVQPDRMEDAIAVNLQAAILHMQYASRLMVKQRCGSIINISSIFGTNGETGQVVYSASKAALIGATKSAAKELAPFNIRVNAIAPGFIETEMTTGLNEKAFADRLASIKMGRIGKPEEVANAIMFLGSDLSSYITGQVLGVDGGMVV